MARLEYQADLVCDRCNSRLRLEAPTLDEVEAVNSLFISFHDHPESNQPLAGRPKEM
jgi:hypothetical protein